MWRPLPLLIVCLCCLPLFIACGENSDQDSPIAPQAEAGPAERYVAAVGPAPANVESAIVEGVITLYWDSVNPGDFNVDGEVSGLDLFPLASRFNQTTGETPGNECIDGNGDGTLNGLDLFIITVNFQHRIDGVNIHSSPNQAGPFDGPALNPTPIAYGGCNEQQEYALEGYAGGPAWFALKSVDNQGSEYSAAGTAIYVVPPPGQPGGVAASVKRFTATVEVTWNANPEGNIAGYDVFSSENIDGPFAKLNTTLLTETSWLDDTLNPGDVRWYTVVAENTSGERSPEAEPGANSGGGHWEYFYPDETTNQGYDNSVVCPSFDNSTWVSYRSDMGWNMMAAHDQLGDGTWTVELIDDTGTTGFLTDISADSAGTVAVAWLSLEGGALFYAEHDGTEWSAPVSIDSEHDTGYHASVGFTQSGDPMIAYYDNTDGMLMLASRSGDEWTIEQIVEIENAPLEMVDNPWYGFAIGYARDGLRQTYREGDSWPWDTALDTPGTTPYADCAASPSGHPAWALRDPADGAMKLLWVQDSTWTFSEVADSSGWYDWVTALAFDPDGVPLVVYADENVSHAVFAWMDGGEWRRIALDPQRYSEVDMTIDQSGNPVVSYMPFGGSNQLKIARWVEPEA